LFYSSLKKSLKKITHKKILVQNGETKYTMLKMFRHFVPEFCFSDFFKEK